MPLTIRAERDDDHSVIHTLTDRAFGAHGQTGIGELVGRLRSGPARVSLVAVLDGDSIVGHVMLSRGSVDAAEQLVEVLILSPLSVDPPNQGQGIGRALVLAAIGAVDQASSLRCSLARVVNPVACTWDMHRRAGLKVVAATGAVEVGSTMLAGLGLGLHLVVPCRVVSVIVEPMRRGFAYGTLPGHPEKGEELFLVTDEGDHGVWFTLSASASRAIR